MAGSGSQLICEKGLGQTPHFLGLLGGVNSIAELFWHCLGTGELCAASIAPTLVPKVYIVGFVLSYILSKCGLSCICFNLQTHSYKFACVHQSLCEWGLTIACHLAFLQLAFNYLSEVTTNHQPLRKINGYTFPVLSARDAAQCLAHARMVLHHSTTYTAFSGLFNWQGSVELWLTKQEIIRCLQVNLDKVGENFKRELHNLKSEIPLRVCLWIHTHNN